MNLRHRFAVTAIEAHHIPEALFDAWPVQNWCMAKQANIIIADESALFFYEHIDTIGSCGAVIARNNPLATSATNAEDLGRFNESHPLYGGLPVSILVRDSLSRRQSHSIKCRYCPDDLPSGSFYKLREGLYIVSPELLFVRMANLVSDVRLAEIGLNLCARYYINLDSGGIDDRSVMLTTPAKLSKYMTKAEGIRGAGKARKVLKWVVANSGSPLESKMMIQYSLPFWAGGLNLPLTHMNYDVSAGRLAKMTEQSEFCIDCVNPRLKVGLEYDGEAAHQDAGKDKRRINALSALGWKVFSIDKSVFYDSERTIQAALQIARYLDMRLRWQKSWRKRFNDLRKDLGLPA